MPNTTKYLGEHFISALRILSYNDSKVTADFLYESFKDHADELIKCGALKQAPYLKDVYVFTGHKMAYKEVNAVNGELYYDLGGGHRRKIDERKIGMYISVVDWSLKNILYGLGAGEDHRYNCILDNFIWSLGDIYFNQHKITIMIVRCITSDKIYQDLAQYLNKYHTKTPVLILAIERYPIPKSFALPSNHVYFDIRDVLINNHRNVSFNQDFILEKMGKKIQHEGFSDGFRSGYIKGISYTFTKKEAEVVEYLYNAGRKPVHQDEIMAVISPNSRHSTISSIFHSRNGKNPALGVIIKYDNKGYYWLDLN